MNDFVYISEIVGLNLHYLPCKFVSLQACMFLHEPMCVRLMTSFALTSLKVMCHCSLVVSPWRYVSCQHDGWEVNKKNSVMEKGLNKDIGKEKEKGRVDRQVNLNAILIRRPLPLLINEILIIGKVVVARSRPLG